MEDFPTQTIILAETNGAQEVKNTSDPISKIPLQFVLIGTIPYYCITAKDSSSEA